MILSVHISGMANAAASLSGVTIILNNNESNNIYLSASASTFLIPTLELGKMVWDKYKIYIFEVYTREISCLNFPLWLQTNTNF